MRPSIYPGGSELIEAQIEGEHLFRLSQEYPHDIYTERKKRGQKTAKSNILGYFAILISTLIGLSMGALVFARQSPSGVMKAPCGNNSSEAHTLGCKFDFISFSWLPSRCFDEDLVNKFSTTREWQWYRDSNGSSEIPFEMIKKGELESAYVTWEYHVMHCVFMWQLLHRKALGPLGRPAVDSYIGNLHHTEHCGKLFTVSNNLRNVNTIIKRKFPDCGVLPLRRP